jgi:hypothetical protein
LHSFINTKVRGRFYPAGDMTSPQRAGLSRFWYG